MIRLLLLFASMVALQAQPLSYGFKVGSPINDPGGNLGLFSTSSQSRWAGGPALELHLPWRFSVEFDALYRTSRANTTFPVRLGTEQNPYLFLSGEKTKTWDFPLLLKYRFSGGRLRPFVSAGASWSHRRNEGIWEYSCLGPQGSCRPPEYPVELFGGAFKSTQTRLGPAAGAGLDIKTGHLTITPEVRWNQWSGQTRNQVTVMVGFAFGRWGVERESIEFDSPVSSDSAPLHTLVAAMLDALATPPVAAETVLAAMRAHPLGRDAARIGAVTEANPGLVTLRTPLGTTRVVDMLSGDQLPRIC